MKSKYCVLRAACCENADAVAAPTRHLSRRAFLAGGASSVVAATAYAARSTQHAVLDVSAQGPVTVTRSDAEVKFPTAVNFRLEAAATPMNEITAASILFRPVGTPTFRRIHLPTVGGENVALDYTLDMQLNPLPPGLDVEYRWLFTLADGSQVRTNTATFFYMDTRQQWRKTQGGPISLWWYKGDDAFAKDALDTATRALTRIKQTLSITMDRPMRVLMYENTRDLRAALPANSVEWVGGVARPDYALILAVVAPGRTSNGELRRVIPHEVAHLVTYQASENPYSGLPRWLDEGLAIRNQETAEVRYGPALRDALDKDRLISLRALNSPFPLDEAQALLSYSQSESVVNYIINDYRPGTIGRLVAAFKDGLSVDQAVQGILQRPLDQLEQEWRAVLRSGGDARPGAPPAGP